jgi:acetyl esterase/lipase
LFPVRRKQSTANKQLKNRANVSYGTDASQKMDIYLPPGRTTAATKAIILIHGGGWSSGDKSDFA